MVSSKASAEYSRNRARLSAETRTWGSSKQCSDRPARFNNCPGSMLCFRRAAIAQLIAKPVTVGPGRVAPSVTAVPPNNVRPVYPTFGVDAMRQRVALHDLADRFAETLYIVTPETIAALHGASASSSSALAAPGRRSRRSRPKSSIGS